ncbi:hypothetical protein EV356DRAFT_540620 [Viridothelium virens]|uniref:Uncharacterized protein n=1 Tax=Viridothelium virens TaxID=1048519 RepID=A0A6A6GTN9_VIRVR|nr:hypothetical protein EV356DRAFT_540620 [Viridothelium virens]
MLNLRIFISRIRSLCSVCLHTYLIFYSCYEPIPPGTSTACSRYVEGSQEFSRRSGVSRIQ